MLVHVNAIAYRKDNAVKVAAEAPEMTTDCSSYVWLWITWEGNCAFPTFNQSKNKWINPS